MMSEGAEESVVLFDEKKVSPSLWLGPCIQGRARRGSNTRPLDLQSNALPTAPQAPGDALLSTPQVLNLQLLLDAVMSVLQPLAVEPGFTSTSFYAKLRYVHGIPFPAIMSSVSFTELKESGINCCT